MTSMRTKSAGTIRILTGIEEKQAARKLYEEAFPQDSPAFVDYYFADKCKDNVITVLESDDGKILSMAHLNPYRLMFCGREVPAYYIVAVATEEKFRHKGMMTRVLEASFDFMKAQGVPFSWLVPMKEKIYRPFGFETICDFSLQRIPYEEVRKNYDVYCLQDQEYLRRSRIEEELAQGDSCTGMPEDPVVMALPADRERMRALLEMPQGASDKELLGQLRKKKIYFCEEV